MDQTSFPAETARNVSGVSAQRSVLRILLDTTLYVSAVNVALRTVPDVDLWGHVRFGLDILNLGAIPTSDSYAFTSDQPWINHEWLAEVMFGWVYEMLGPTGLIMLRWTVLALLFGLTWSYLRRLRMSRWSAMSLIAFVALLTYPRMQHVRPQLFSVLGFTVLLISLKQAERGNRLFLAVVPVLMVLWANLHGGWIVGIGVLGLWGIVHAMRPDSRGLGYIAIVVAVVSCLGSLLNPYGFQLWEFLWRTVRLRRDDIVEWQSVLRAGGGVLALWLVTVLLALRVLFRRRISNTADITIVAVLGVASFRVSRLDTFFVLAVVILFGKSLLSSSLPDDDERPIKDFWSLAPRRGVFVGAMIPFALLLIAHVPVQMSCLDLTDADWLPEREAVTFFRVNHLSGRLLTFFDWGEYGIWHLSPSIKVSIDGRRETVYSNQQIVGHLMLYANRPEGMAYIRTIAPDYAWLPVESSIVPALKQEGWVERFIGPRSIVLSRVAGAEARLTAKPAAADLPRCFPGP